jgi:hypothetical protein
MNGSEPGIVRQARQKPCYCRLWERGVECFTCGLPCDGPWFGHICKRPRLYCVPNEIEAEGKTVENREPAHEEHVNASLQLIRQLLIAPTCPPNFARIIEQRLEFILALGATAIAVAHRLP